MVVANYGLINKSTSIAYFLLKISWAWAAVGSEDNYALFTGRLKSGHLLQSGGILRGNVFSNFLKASWLMLDCVGESEAC